MPHERLTWPQVIKTLIYKDPHYWAVWSAKILTTVLSTNIDDDIVKNSLTPLLYWHDWPVGNCRPLQLLIICPSLGQGREPGRRKYSLSFISTFTMLYQLAAEPRNLEHWGCCFQPSHLQLRRTDILFKTQTFNFGKQILGWDGGWEFILRVKFIWGERGVSEPGSGTIKMIYLAPHEYSQCISLLGTKSINIKMVNYVANVTANPHLESLFLNSKNFYLAIQTSLNSALLNLRQ